MDGHSWFTETDKQIRYDLPRVSIHGALIRCIDVGRPGGFNGTEIHLPNGNRLLIFRHEHGDRLHYLVTEADGGSLAGDLGLSGNIDPRLTIFRGNVYLTTAFATRGHATCQVELRTVHFDGESLHPILSVVGKFDTVHGWPGYLKPRHEKNWAPFSQGGRFFFVHRIRPHRVLELEHGQGVVKLAYESELGNVACWGPNVSSCDLRSNAPPVQLTDGSFLSTYHFVLAGGYYTGFYRFGGVPPFRPLSFTTPLLTPDDAEKPIRSNQNRRCLFINGMIVDETKDVVTLWGGDSDCRVINVEAPLSTILRNMVLV
jgi:hypothetical protein